jgi:beta-lactamase regulating signal transducer with metallopeptidase domain/type II secretory pathway component GspD/PulD (secretin)
MIGLFNHLGDGFFRFAWPMLWQSSVLILMIFALDWALRRKVQAAVRYALWLVVVVKLVLPPSLALPTGLAWWLRSSAVRSLPAATRQFVVSYSDEPMLADSYVAAAAAPVPPPAPRLSLKAIALLANGGVSLMLFGYLIWRLLLVARQISRNEAPSDELRGLFNEVAREAGVRGRVRLRLTNASMSPAVCGLIRPCVVLPRALVEKLGSAESRAVLLHELMHVRRADVWVNCAQTLLQFVYWWHPLLWFANSRIRGLREEAVDDEVMMALREEADVYATTLVEVARLAFHRPLASLGLVGILESKRALSRRIERLLDFQPPRRTGLSFASALAVAAFTCMAVPQGEAPVKPKAATDLAQSEVLSAANTATSHETNVRAEVEATAPDAREKSIKLTREAAESLSARTVEDPARNGGEGVVLRATGTVRTANRVTWDPEKGEVTAEGDVKLRRTDANGGATNSSPELTIRTFRPNPTNTLRNLERAAGAASGSLTWTNLTPVLRSYLHSRGVDLDPPKNIFWTQGQGTLLVRGTMKDLDTIEMELQALSVPETHGDALSTRVFRLDPNTFLLGLESAAGVAPGTFAQSNSASSPPANTTEQGSGSGRIVTRVMSLDDQKIADAVKQWFGASGVDLDPPKNLFWDGRRSTLLVRATKEDLEKIESELAKHAAPPQIHIRAKFVAIPQKESAALWKSLGATNGPSGPEGVIVSSTQGAEVLKGLKSKKGAEVLSEPSVVTLSGRQAQIQVVNSQTVVTGVTNGATEPDFLTEEVKCGPVLDVTPNLVQGADAIELRTVVTVTEFLGYDDPKKDFVEVLVGDELTKVKPPLPHFRIRNLVTNVAVLDGQTLVLGRPQITETVNNKVVKPTVVKKDSKDLVVFITPTLIDAVGNRLRK